MYILSNVIVTYRQGLEPNHKESDLGPAVPD
jgi:hypothetical protein